MLDEPGRQRQRPYLVDLDTVGNIAVLGAGGAGKSAALRAIAVAASREAVSHPLTIHAIDAGGGALAMLEGLPTVSSVITGSDTERITRMLAATSAEAEKRSVAFAAARASSLAEYRTVTGVPLPRVLLLIDGFPTFRAEHEFSADGDFDRLLALASVGRQLGIHLVVAADRATALPSAFAASVGERIVLRLAGAAEYAAAGIAGDGLADAPPGRALVRGDECQLGAPGGAPDLLGQAATIDGLAARLRRRGVSDSAPIERLSEAIEADDLPPTVGERPTFGVSYDALAAVGLPLDGLFVVTGPFGSGRTTAMTTAVRSVRRSYPGRRLFLLAVRRGPLHAATEWTESSQDPEGAAALAARLSAELDAARGAVGTAAPLIVVEGVGDFEGLPAEAQVVALLRAARRCGAPVLVEADTVTAPAAWQLFAELKTARAGIVLQPDEADGSVLFRTPFPRVPRADLPPGRGFLVEAGRAVRMQVALPPRVVIPSTDRPEQ
jgi:S-DNA-T family DNA segregation ATPase FtsK/SpoIIIE